MPLTFNIAVDYIANILPVRINDGYSVQGQVQYISLYRFKFLVIPVGIEILSDSTLMWNFSLRISVITSVNRR